MRTSHDAEQVIARTVRSERERHGLTQQELATRLTAAGMPIHQTGLGRLEAGQRAIRIDELYTIAAALDISPLALLPSLSDAAGGDPVTVARLHLIAAQVALEEVHD